MELLQNRSSWAENYGLFVPEAVTDIAPQEVPEAVAAHFQDMSGRLTKSPVLQLGQFDRLMKIDVGDGLVTYFAQHDKYYDHAEVTDRVVYVADVDRQGNIAGYGELCHYDITDPDIAPSVFMNRTMGEQGLGFGTRRLLVMNVASQVIFGKILKSDLLLSPGATRAWQHLVDAGLAETYLHESPGLFNGTERFRFK